MLNNEGHKKKAGETRPFFIFKKPRKQLVKKAKVMVKSLAEAVINFVP